MIPEARVTYRTEWTTEEVGIARRMARAGKSAATLKDALGSPLTIEGIQRRCAKLGIRISKSEGKARALA